MEEGNSDSPLKKAIVCVREWEAEAQLGIVFNDFQAVLLEYAFSRGQIMNCFECFVEAKCLNMIWELDREPTLHEFQERIREIISLEKTTIIAICTGMSEEENL